MTKNSSDKAQREKAMMALKFFFRDSFEWFMLLKFKLELTMITTPFQSMAYQKRVHARMFMQSKDIIKQLWTSSNKFDQF